MRTIAVPDLEPGGTFAFEQTYDVDEDATPHIEVYRGSEPIDVFDTKWDAKMRAVLELATLAYTETGFALEYHSTKDDIEVTGEMPPSFETRAQDEQKRAAKAVYDRYTALRGIYGSPAEARLSIRIHVQARPATYDYDGEQLKRVD